MSFQLCKSNNYSVQINSNFKFGSFSGSFSIILFHNAGKWQGHKGKKVILTMCYVTAPQCSVDQVYPMPFSPIIFSAYHRFTELLRHFKSRSIIFLLSVFSIVGLNTSQKYCTANLSQDGIYFQKKALLSMNSLFFLPL